ncbi:YhfX family PLP-dependent enzyme [Paenibacillus sp. strain BS8-2]
MSKTVERNAALVHYAIELHQSGQIMPDTYVIDLDAVMSNADVMLQEASRYNIQLLFMTKQFGRNPIISKALASLGFQGAVAVDYREAETLHHFGIPLAHVGHLVQTPTRMMEDVVKMAPDWMTIYSVDKAKELSDVCRRLGITQNILLRVIDHADTLYPGQYGGFKLNELAEHVEQLLKIPNIRINGLTSFPCFLYDPAIGDIVPTPNVDTLHKAKALLETRFGIQIEHMNMPSATCTHTISQISALGGTHGEPGHGLLGTTPMHAATDLAERPAIVYVSEVSHQLDDRSYCYGGGYYQRTLVKEAVVASGNNSYVRSVIHSPSPHSIDYHFEMEGKHPVGQTVIMAFRTQIFVTRSLVAVVAGLSTGRPQLLGVHDSQGKPCLEVSYG